MSEKMAQKKRNATSPGLGAQDIEANKQHTNGVGNSCACGVNSMSMTSISCKPEYKKQISKVNLIDEPEGRSLVVKIRRSLSCSMGVRLVIIMGILAVAFLTMVGLYVAATTKSTPALVNSCSDTKEDRRKTCVTKAKPRPLNGIPKQLKDMLEILHETSRDTFSKSSAKAMSLSIYYQGEKWSELHLGRLNYSDSNSPPPDENTVWPMASVTKVFTSLMLEKLHDLGTIPSLDDPVKKYSPSFKIRKKPGEEDVTLRQLSCMMSGLPREAPCYPPAQYNYCPYTSEEMLRNISKVSRSLQPDTFPVYSNLGFGILGDTLDKIASPSTYKKWISDNILYPLNMTKTGFGLRSRVKDIPISTSIKNENVDVMDWGWLDSSGGMYSTAKDLAKLSNVLLEVSKVSILKNSTVRRSLKSVYSFGHGSSRGCPYEIMDFGMYRAYYKSGAAIGYTALLVVFPELKLNVNLMIANGGDELAEPKIVKPYLSTFSSYLAEYLRNTSAKYILPRSANAFIGSYKIVSVWPSVTKPAKVDIENGNLVIAIEWFTAALEEINEWTLKAIYSDDILQSKDCRHYIEATGLYTSVFKFDQPKAPGQQSSGFSVDGISAYGYLRFERIPTK